jgi:NTE family protein
MKVITTNLEEGLTTVFEQGPIIDALVASCSIPVVFPPVKIGNASYMDGGIFKNFPVSIIRSECEKIIGVNVSPLVSKKSNQSIMHIAERTFHYMSRNNTLLDRNLCDILIEMKDLVDYNILDLKSAAKIFKLGYENAQKSLNNSPLISPFE